MSASHVKPPKLIKAAVTNIEVESVWTTGPDTDFYYGYPYRWRYTLQVDPQEHGDYSSPNPFFYDGMALQVGDWIAATTGGSANQIMSIESQDSTNVVVVVEDIERFNLYLEPSSNSSYGAGVEGQAIIFQIGDDGLPIMGPLAPNYVSPSMQSDMIARFRYRNLLRSFVRVNAPGHDMKVGDVIRPDFANPGKFVKAKADANVASVIGVVSDVNTPSEDWYNFKPFGEIRENVKPDLVGNYGDFFYVDPTTPGALTKNRPFNNARPVYMRLENDNRAMLLAGSENLDHNETQRYNVVAPAAGQVNFVVPADAEEVLWMSINGIENTNFTFDVDSKAIVFDPVATGYGVDVTDEVFFIYKS